MALKVYTYKNCSTCRKARAFLKEHELEYRDLPIRDQPPTFAELKKMLGYAGGTIQKLFNTSGGDYKALKMRGEIVGLDTNQALALLASNGSLVKRPFILGEGCGAVGFKEHEWREKFL